MAAVEVWTRQEPHPRERIDINSWLNGKGFYMDFCLSDGEVIPSQGDRWTRLAYGVLKGQEFLATMDFVGGRILSSRVPTSVELSGFFINAIAQIEDRKLATRFRQRTAKALPILKMHEFLEMSAGGIIELGEETLRRLHQAA